MVKQKPDASIKDIIMKQPHIYRPYKNIKNLEKIKVLTYNQNKNYLSQVHLALYLQFKQFV